MPISEIQKCPICHHPADVYQLLGPDGKPVKHQHEEQAQPVEEFTEVVPETVSEEVHTDFSADIDSILNEITSEIDSDGFMELVAPVEEEAAADTDDLSYPSEFAKYYDDDDRAMADIHKIATSGEDILSSMSTQRKLPSWDDIRILPAQFNPSPLNSVEPVDTTTVIGKDALQPMVIESPIIISHMSFGALSPEAKVALAKGSAMAKTAIGSGDGGILQEEMDSAYKYIFEYVPGLFSVTDDNLRKTDAIEIKLGQSARAGLGSYLPAKKVSAEVAAIRGCTEGEDFYGEANFYDVANREELRKLVYNLRERSDGRPIGIKIAAGNIEHDLAYITYAEPDFITIDGAEGSCDVTSKIVRDSACLPTIYALARAKKYMSDNGINNISIIITGGLRIASDFAKAIALGADAVAIGTAAMMSLACHQYRMCETGECPMGVATQDPALRSRLQKEVGSKRVANFLNVSLEQLKEFARITGNESVHSLSPRNLVTIDKDIAENTGIAHI